MKNKRQKPLATVGVDPRAEIHRAKFHAFESMKYLNLAALKRASKASIEIGRIEGGGAEATIVAEVRKGVITKLTPLACKGCAEATNKLRTSRRTARPATKRLLREALVRVRDRGYPVIKLPMPLTTRSLDIPIGPIIIVIGPGFDLCVVVEWANGEICIYCLLSPGLCVGPIIVE